MINFNFCNFAKYPQTSLENILKETPGVGELIFYHSRNKIVFSSSNDDHSIIYKIPLRQDSMNRALALFHFAEKEGLSCFFAKNMLIYKCKEVTIFAQKKVVPFIECGEARFNQNINLLVKDLCKDYINMVMNRVYVDSFEQSPNEFYAWIQYAIDEKGTSVTQLKKFLDFIIEYAVFDLLPSENVGFDGDQPIVIDYDGCFNY